MELPIDLCQWLISANVLTEYDVKSKDTSKVLLESEPSKLLESGLKMPELIKRLHEQKVQPMFS